MKKLFLFVSEQGGYRDGRDKLQLGGEYPFDQDSEGREFGAQEYEEGADDYAIR